MNTPTEPLKYGPSSAWYGVAAAVFVIGIMAFGFRLYSSLAGIGDGLLNYPFPGHQLVSLNQPGLHQVFYEHTGVHKGEVFRTDPSGAPPIRCKLRDADGLEISLRSSGSMNYDFGGRKGFALFEFLAPQIGVYDLTCQYPEPGGGPRILLTVGQMDTEQFIRVIFECVAIFFGTLFISLAIVLVTVFRRRANRDRLLSSQ